MSITQARQQFLKLADSLSPSDSIEVERNSKAILRIVKMSSSNELSPFELIQAVLDDLPNSKTKKSFPQDLAANYKDYLYGKKKAR